MVPRNQMSLAKKAVPRSVSVHLKNGAWPARESRSMAPGWAEGLNRNTEDLGSVEWFQIPESRLFVYLII